MSKSQYNKFSPEVHERAVRSVQEHRDECPLQWAGGAVDCTQERLLGPHPVEVQLQKVEAGRRPSVPQAERERIKAIEREVKELRLPNETLKSASAFFALGGARPRT